MNSEPRPITRFLRRTAAFLLLQALVAAVVISFGSPGNSNHYLGAIQDKITRLEACKGPRVVILGGSNVAFGICSPVMQQSLDMETVNLGLHASLGLAFQTECYLPHARSGDIVVLCPEYHLLTSDEHQAGDPRLIDQLLEHCPDADRYLSKSNQASWKQFLDHDGLWLAHQWVGRAFRSMRKVNTSDKIYSRASFNEFGDVIAHYGQHTETMMPLGPIPSITPETVDRTAALLNQFDQECQRKGVYVYFSYPPLMDSLFQDSQDAIENLYRSLAERVDIPLLNDPKEFAYAQDRFFDTGYHLNQEAAEARTRAIAAAIQREHFGRLSMRMANRK